MILVFLTASAASALSAQVLSGGSVFSGPYRAGSFSGNATFDFQETSQDTIITGLFKFRGGNVRSLLDGKDSYFAFEGNYEEGDMAGEWGFSFGDLSAAGPGELTNYEFRLRLNGTQHTATGNIVDGKPDGTWTQQLTRITDSEATGDILKAEINFLAGVPAKTLSVASGNDSVLGRFKRDGQAHDAWVVYDDLIPSETWYFQDGLLEYVEVVTAGDSIRIPVFSNDLDRTKTINLDGTYLALLSDWQQLQDEPNPFEDSPAPALLAQNAERFDRVIKAARALGAEDFQPTFAVKVPNYPLAKKQERQLIAIAEDLARLDTLTRRATGANSLAVIRSQDDEVAFSLAALAELDETFVAPVRRLTEAFRDGRLEYLPLDVYVRKLWDEPASGDFPVKYFVGESPNERVYFGPGSRTFDVSRNGLEEAAALMDYAIASAEELRGALNAKLNTKERRVVVRALEDQLTFELNRLDSLISTFGRRAARDYNLNAIRAAARREVQTYASNEDLLDKRTQGEALITCMETMEALVLNLTDIPIVQEDLQELYTDEIWNHNLAVLMSEKVKRRVIDAYDDVLIPSFTDRVNDQLTCSSARTLNDDINFVNNRMRALRKADTDELEDELKGVRNPTRVLALLRPSTPQ